MHSKRYFTICLVVSVLAMGPSYAGCRAAAVASVSEAPPAGGDQVSQNKLSRLLGAAGAMVTSLADPDTIARACALAVAARDSSRPIDPSTGLVGGDGRYTPSQVKQMSVKTLMERVARPEPGYHSFSGLWGLIEKAKGGDADTRESVISEVTGVINDDYAPFKERWHCCYVLAEIGDDRAVPDLIRLSRARNSGISGFAAEALVTLYRETHSPVAKEALLAEVAGNPAVQEVLSRRLREVVPRGEAIPVGIKMPE